MNERESALHVHLGKKQLGSDQDRGEPSTFTFRQKCKFHTVKMFYSKYDALMFPRIITCTCTLVYVVYCGGFPAAGSSSTPLISTLLFGFSLDKPLKY